MRRLLGLVLAGGASRRFGSDKALAMVAGRPMIAYGVDTIAPFVAAIAIGGRDYGGFARIADRPAPGLGPLGGLAGALHHAACHDYTHVLSIACDTPFVPATALAALTAMDGACAIAEHPVIGIWPASLSPHLDRFLEEGPSRSMRAWMASCDAQRIAIDGIANINFPADLAALIDGTTRDTPG